MKPSVINAAAAGNGSAGAGATNGVTIPINHEYGAQQQQRQHRSQSPHSQYPPQQQQFNDPSGGGGPGFAGSPAGGQRQFPAHFQQDFGFEPDMDDMFSRSRLGRMHDPFAGFGTRKRCGNDPQSAAPDGFSHYFNDDPDFDFPQFGTLGRRRAAAAAAGAGAGQPIDPHASMGRDEHDFFNRLPSEFRQYIPDSFGHSRRSAAPPSSTMPPTQGQAYYAAQTPQKQQHQYYGNANNTPPSNSAGGSSPQSPSKKLCDAAIQTEDPSVGGAAEQLNQHSLRNTIDMGVKSTPESEEHGHRAHSAPPNEQQQQQQQPSHANGKRRTPPPAGQHGTQTSPRAGARSPPFHKVYYAPQQHAHPHQQQQQQKQQTPPPPQTPGGTYVRTIPIYVEGRSEPIINSHKEIPNQNAASAGPASNASATPRTYVQPPQHHQPQYPTQHHPQHQQQQQQHRPTPFNTQQQHQQKPPQQPNTGAGAAPTGPPQTPHTMDSINKIQDIQRDVLDLMGKVEKFGGKRQDKEYAYLDEMLTRNLLKLDTIDTNGKDSIRLARKEAIKCIQASINVLEAKAEENARLEAAAQEPQPSQEAVPELKAAKGQLDVTKEADVPQKQKRAEATATAAAPPAAAAEAQPVDATKITEPIPLPPPEGVQVDSNKNDRNEEELQSTEQPTKESSPQRQEEAASATSITTAE